MNAAFDLASLAQQGEATEKLPARSRRRSQNPFAVIVARVANEKLTWKYPPVSTLADNGETSVAQQVENGIRQAGNALDKSDRASGGPGWKTIVRKQLNTDGTEVTISFTVERRSESGETPVAADETTEASTDGGGSRRRSRG